MHVCLLQNNVFMAINKTIQRESCLLVVLYNVIADLLENDFKHKATTGLVLLKVHRDQSLLGTKTGIKIPGIMGLGT